jgi:hypothetical protein
MTNTIENAQECLRDISAKTLCHAHLLAAIKALEEDNFLLVRDALDHANRELRNAQIKHENPGR